MNAVKIIMKNFHSFHLCGFVIKKEQEKKLFSRERDRDRESNKEKKKE